MIHKYNIISSGLQQLHFFFFIFVVPCLSKMPVYSKMCWFLLFFIYRAIKKKASSTFIPLLALTSSNIMLCLKASYFPSLVSTSLSLSRSILVPIRMRIASSSLLISICLIQMGMLLNDFRLLI